MAGDRGEHADLFTCLLQCFLCLFPFGNIPDNRNYLLLFAETDDMGIDLDRYNRTILSPVVCLEPRTALRPQFLPDLLKRTVVVICRDVERAECEQLPAGILQHPASDVIKIDVLPGEAVSVYRMYLDRIIGVVEYITEFLLALF